jgi:sulfate/thiosulfate transport system substrate-binding protein
LSRTAALTSTVTAVAVALAAAGCGGSSDSTAADSSPSSSGAVTTTLSLVAYSTPQVVYDQLTPQFTKTAAGRGVGVQASYGASGEQSRAVAGGLKADVVAFSLAPDVNKLVDAGLVDKDWAGTPTKGFVSTSTVVFVVRKGNPKNIRSWSDLVKGDTEVLTPNPFTSGGAKWNLLAAIGAKGLPFARTLLTEHVKVQDKSGRESLQTFLQGKGDVALSYENEAITAQKKGEDVDYVIPADGSIKIENPIAVTTKAPPQAKAFVDFALSKAGQQDFADWGYRPVDASVLAANQAKFPSVTGEFTVARFGGWSKANDTYFDPDKGAVAKIEQDAGVSTAK